MTWKIRKSGNTVFVAVGHSLRVSAPRFNGGDTNYLWEVRPLGSARTKAKNRGVVRTLEEGKAEAVARLREIVADGLAKLETL